MSDKCSNQGSHHTVGVLANLIFQQKSAACSLIPPETCLWSWFCFLPLCKPIIFCFAHFNPCQHPSVFSCYFLTSPQTGSHFSHAFLTWGLRELETRTCLSRLPSELRRKFCKTGVYPTSAPRNSRGLAGDTHIINLRPAIANQEMHGCLWSSSFTTQRCSDRHPHQLAGYLRLGCHC